MGYTPTRQRAGPEKFLEGYKGYLEADAYGGYDAFFVNPARVDSDQARMGPVLLLIAQLYKIEEQARSFSADERLALRQLKSRPILDKLHAYLLEIEAELLPKSPARQAVRYVLKNWIALNRYCEDGNLEIDNNYTERSIRGIAVGRGNWTFLGSDNGGKTAAILRSFVGTCQLNKIDPFAYLKDILSRIATHPINRISELLPNNWATAQA